MADANDLFTQDESHTSPAPCAEGGLTGIVKQFKDDWRQERRPALADYLPLETGARRQALIALVHADLELRLQAGEAARVETYLEHYPELAQERRALLDLIAAEFQLRRQREPGLLSNGYLMRFTPFADELADRLARVEGQAAADTSAPASGRPAAAHDWPNISGYEILAELGWGGMGVVYKARQLSLNRLVALKVIRAERWANTETAVKRFRREAQAAAQLLHSHIVAVHDAGQDGAIHFLAMEYVDGIDLAKLVKRSGPLPVVQACEYVRQVALGLQHAHERGLVHRDIKPANLIVSPTPAVIEPLPGRSEHEPGYRLLPFRDSIVKILDMGLARLDPLLHGDAPHDEAEGGLTSYGAFMGTPDFMAPEQARDPRSADIRADLYSLGCTFYYLLTGRAPFPGGTAAEKRDRHQAEEPFPLVHLRPEISSGVATIVRILMAKDREDRFPTPHDLVVALKPFIQAQAGEEALLDPPHPKSKSSWEIRLPKYLPASNGADNRSRLSLGEEVRCFTGHTDWVWGVAFADDGRFAVSGSRDRTVRLWDVHTGEEVRRFEGHRDDVLSVALSRDGRFVLSGGADKVMRLWSVETGKELRAFEGHTDGILGVAFFPEQQPSQSEWGWLTAVANLSVAFSAETRFLLSGSRDGTIRLWDLESGLEMRRLHGRSEIVSVAFSRDGLSALTNNANNLVQLWAVENGRELCRFDGAANPIWSISLAPDGRRVLSGSADRSVRLWDVESGEELLRCAGHADWVTSVAFSHDGRRALSGSEDKTMRLWNAESGELLYSFEGHRDGVTSVAFSNDDFYALSGSSDKTVRVWRLFSRKTL